MSIKDMPHVTVEQVVNLRDKAMQLEKDRDEWKAQAEGEAIVAGSYRDEMDALAAHVEQANLQVDAFRKVEGSPLYLAHLIGKWRDDSPETSLAKLKAKWQAEVLQYLLDNEVSHDWEGNACVWREDIVHHRDEYQRKLTEGKAAMIKQKYCKGESCNASPTSLEHSVECAFEHFMAYSGNGDNAECLAMLELVRELRRQAGGDV